MNPGGLSVIVPARNEERLLRQTLECILSSADALEEGIPREILVVDHQSEDTTFAIASSFPDVRIVTCSTPGAGAARNAGARQARGDVFVFVDADTRIPRESLRRIHGLSARFEVGMFGLRGEESSLAAHFWWRHFGWVRSLPLPAVKAMSAFMFCKRPLFEELGGFDEAVRIGEEWAILAEGYRRNRKAFVYDRSLTAWTSGRRMEQQRFGYARTYLRYLSALFHPPSRMSYPDHYR
jgi:glycosyltransferase involved in cell wall biosynthesis